MALRKTAILRARHDADYASVPVRKEGKRRTRKCAVKACRAEFEPRSMTHKCCGAACAADFAMSERVRKERSERQEGLRALKTKGDHVKDAQQAFNAFCRERDKGQQCISCDVHLSAVTTSAGGGVDCGHFRSRGSAPHLRFDERNAHGQCKRCNRYLSGNVTEYRPRLIARIGLAAVEALEADNEPRRYTIEQLIELKNHYRAKLRSLTKGNT